MTERSQSHLAITKFQAVHNGHNEFPYPYNAWATQIFTLSDFANAFSKHIQQQRIRVPTAHWGEECDVHYALLNEMVRSYELPQDIAQELWRSLSDQQQIVSAQETAHKTEPSHPQSNQKRSQIETSINIVAEEKSAEKQAQAVNLEDTSFDNEPERRQHPRRRAHDTVLPACAPFSAHEGNIADQFLEQESKAVQSTQKADKTKTVIETSFIAYRDKSIQQPQKSRFTGSLLAVLFAIILFNFGLIATLVLSNQSEIFRSLHSFLPLEPMSNQSEITPTYAQIPTFQTNNDNSESKQSKPEVNADKAALLAALDVTIQEDSLETSVKQDVSMEHIIKKAKALNNSQRSSPQPSTTKTIRNNEAILLELMRQTSELNIEPVTDEDTALYYLKQLELHNATHDELSRAHFSIHNGFEALSTLANARGHSITAQRFKNRARSHAIISQEFQDAVPAE